MADRKKKAVTFEELKVHINEEEDIKLIESKLTKVLSSKFEKGTLKTEYYCGKCKKPHTYEVESEEAYKVMLPEKCPECGQKISRKNDFSAFFIWRTAIVNGIKRFLVALYKLRNEEFILEGIMALGEEGTVKGYRLQYYGFKAATISFIYCWETENPFNYFWGNSKEELENQIGSDLVNNSAIRLDTVMDAFLKKKVVRKVNRTDKRVTLFKKIEALLPEPPEPNFKEPLPYAIYSENGVDLLSHTKEISAVCPVCGKTSTYTVKECLQVIINNLRCSHCNNELVLLPSQEAVENKRTHQFVTLVDDAEIDGVLYIVTRNIRYVRKAYVPDTVQTDVVESYVVSKEERFKITSSGRAEKMLAYSNYSDIVVRAESLKYSAIDIYLKSSLKDNFIAYIEAFLNNPLIEKATKDGLAYEYLHTNLFDKSKSTLFEALQINRRYYNILQVICPKVNGVYTAYPMPIRTNTHYGNSKSVYNVIKTMQEISIIEPNPSEEDIRYILDNEIKTDFIIRIKNVLKDISLKTMLEYIQRVNMFQCIPVASAAGEWADYLYAAEKLQMDLTDRKVKYPNSLRREHDICTFKWQTILEANKKEYFADACKEIKQEYSYEGKDYLITAPMSYEELFEEGRKLSHCVGNYGDRILEHTTNILFLRKKKNPSEPFYTIEVSNSRRIVQIRGLRNCYLEEKNPECLSFIAEWKEKKQIV